MSFELPIKVGVPQGSILGPILFLIFVNDLTVAIKNVFADDSMIHCDGRDYMEVQVKLQQNTANIEQWFRSIRLTANVSKSDCMLIGTRQRLHDPPALIIVLNGRGLPDLQQYDYPNVRCFWPSK